MSERGNFFYICLNCLSEAFCEYEGEVRCANCDDSELVVLDFGELSEKVASAASGELVFPDLIYAALAAAGIGKVVGGSVGGKELFDTVVKKYKESCYLHGIDDILVEEVIRNSIGTAVRVAGERGEWGFALSYLV